MLWFPRLYECGLLGVFLLCGLPGVLLLIKVTCLTAANQAEHAAMKMLRLPDSTYLWLTEEAINVTFSHCSPLEVID